MKIKLPPTPPNPWKKIGTKKLYENPWMELYEDDVVRPDGSKGIYGKPVFGKSIATAVLRSDGKILLVGQWRYLLNMYTWEVPTGGCNKGENPLDTAKRELQEEAGVTGKRWTAIGKITIPHIIDEGNLFLVEEIEVGKQHQDDVEDIHLHWLPFKDAIQLVDDGVITGWLSQIMLLKVDRYLKSRNKT
ncbi:MAG: NUDIX hydrolase [Patescibacteria group bacterium]|jgi:8-oxo-dGTP pyrophosphatase MutT (NUDIX family)